MSRAELRPDLEAVVAAGMIRNWASRAGQDIELAAQTLAPAGKTWVTMHDQLVRATHRDADGQTIPANVPYELDRPQAGPTVHGQASHAATGGGQGDAAAYRKLQGAGKEYADRPRDPGLSPGNRYNCRCSSILLPGAVGGSIHASAVEVAGTEVRVTVSTRYPKAGESEFGTSRSAGAHFMGRALREFADRLRSAGASRGL